MKYRTLIARYLKNIPGWRTSRKILIIESDDWGSIRMPTRQTFDRCKEAGYPVEKSDYTQYDTLLSQEDLELLFTLLSSFHDINGCPPVITANSVVANPDFERIRKNNYEKYYYELVTETFKRYPKHANNFAIWKHGIKERVFFPQFHCREHLNVSLFMKALQEHDPDIHFAFDNGMPGIFPKASINPGNYYVEATNYSSDTDKCEKLAIYLEGLDIFKKLFGYKSESIVPPNYIWSPDYNQPVYNKGGWIFQGVRVMNVPKPGEQYDYYKITLGMRNELGQLFLVRNCLFEPSMRKYGITDPVDFCLRDIAAAFRMNKPAIMCSHRINFSGMLDVVNRDNTLKFLERLLSSALKKWPDIEFMTSPRLAEVIINSNC